MEAPIELSRDVEAIQIPEGHRVTLTKGMAVRISQALGGSFTVVTDWGILARIDAKDADSIGKTVEKAPEAELKKDEPLETQVWNQLRTCYDPEIPVNMVDLGLIYVCNVVTLEGDKHRVEIKFTLTAPGCGMGDILQNDVKEKVGALPGVAETDVQIVFDPPWDRSMMSEAAKLQLGMY